MIKHHSLSLILAVFLLLVAGGCETQPDIRTSSSGETVQKDVGDTVEFTVGGNPGTGYKWRVVEVPPHLTQQGEPKMEIRAAGAGFPTMADYTYRFKVTSAGQGQLRLEYRHPDSPDEPPAEVFELNVVGRR